jgi:hypothetical protein
MAKRDKGEGPDGAQKRKGAGRPPREHWKEEPDEHDYPAAQDYLSLLLGQADAARLVKALQQATVTHRKAKDLLRASRLGLLGSEDPEVMKDLRKVRRDERLSPVLLVRGSLPSDVPMTVADGYHRICASYHLDEDADIPCRIVDPPREPRAVRMQTSLHSGSRRSRGTVPDSGEGGG